MMKTKSYVVIVSGSRDKRYETDFFKDQIWFVLDTLNTIRPITFLAEGGQTGVDTAAVAWRTDRKIEGKSFFADWSQYGRSAGPIRNKMMYDAVTPNLIILFPGGLGTSSMKRVALSKGTKFIEVGLHDTPEQLLEAKDIKNDVYRLLESEIIPDDPVDNNLSLTELIT